jgi:hypothetical protein
MGMLLEGTRPAAAAAPALALLLLLHDSRLQPTADGKPAETPRGGKW